MQQLQHDSVEEEMAIFRRALERARELGQLRQTAGSLAQGDLEPLMAAAGTALPATRLPTQIEYTGDALLLRGLELNPEELAAMNQRLAADGYAAQSQEGALQLRAQERP